MWLICSFTIDVIWDYGGIWTIFVVDFQTTWKGWKDQYWRENCTSGEESVNKCAETKNIISGFWRFAFGFSRTVRLYCSFVTKELLLSNPKYAFWENYTVSTLGFCHFCSYLFVKIQVLVLALDWVCSCSHLWLSVLGSFRTGEPNTNFSGWWDNWRG